MAKGSISTLSCDLATNGFQTQNDYILGPGGEQMTEMTMDSDASMYVAHNNVWAGGKLQATYDADGDLHFYLTDPLGSRRVMTNYAGVVEQNCQNLPFGDGENCGPTPTEHLFTGKERDSESGNDYFGARYYASTMGRFMSPDWSDAPDTIPYGDLKNPQSLNLYSYVNNNPLGSVDVDGHTHQDCTTTNSSSMDGNGTLHITVSMHCVDVPDWWNIGTNYQNWRQKMADDWNKRIEAHRPPQGPTSELKPLQDMNDIMMGVGPVLAYGRFGWRNGPKWRQAVKELMKPGTHETIAGEVPTRDQATMMIEENGGTISRGGAGQSMDPGEEFGHDPGGVSDHTYPHINYETPSGMKATIKVAP